MTSSWLPLNSHKSHVILSIESNRISVHAVIQKFRNVMHWFCIVVVKNIPDSKVHGVDMGPTWGRQDPGGPHVGPMNFAIWGWLYGKIRGFVDQLISVMIASSGVKMLAKIKMSASMDDVIFLKRIMIKVSSVLTSPSNDILHKNKIFCWD